MRTLPAELTAAQQSASNEPLVDVTVENSIAGMRRLDFEQMDATVNSTGPHDAAVAGDGSLTRTRIVGGSVYAQRYPAAWATLQTGKGGHVKCDARGARVAVIYTAAGNNDIYFEESTDYGVTFGAAVLVASATPMGGVWDIAVAYKNVGGDCAVAYLNGTTFVVTKRTAGTWGGGGTWSGIGFAAASGLSMLYVYDWELAITGTATTTNKPTLWTAIYGDGNDQPAGTLSSLTVQFDAEADASVGYAAPSLGWIDGYHLLFTEADGFTGGATRVWHTTLHPSLTYAAGTRTWRAPAPVNYATSYGLAWANDLAGVGQAYMSSYNTILAAPTTQLLTTLTDDVLAIELDDEPYAMRGHVDLDNTSGAYAGPPAPIQVGNLIAISWGYQTSVGPLSSRGPDTWIAGYEYRRSGGVSVLRLHIEGGWAALARSQQRGQVTHTADTYLTILNRIFARAGLLLTTSAVSTRAQTVVPQFTIPADASGMTSARRALAYLADRITLRPLAAALITEPLASGASAYTFGTNHPLRAFAFRVAPPPVREAQAYGLAAYGEAFDYANAWTGIGDRESLRDITSTTGATAAATAAAHLRQRALDAPAGHLVAPPNCGQERLDAIDFTDDRVGPDPTVRRVAAIRWRFDKRRAVYEQTLDLGAM